MSSMQTTALVDTPLAAPENGGHVLLVDDDPIQLRLARAHLLTAGFSVSTASGAAEALEAAHRQRPDAIVSDVMMDELDGFALCSVFRCDAALDGVPIVLMTAHLNGDDDRRLAIATGARTVVERSPEFQRELAALHDALGLDTASSGDARTWRPAPYARRLAGQMAQLLAKSRAAEARYRTLLDNANEAIAVLTPEGVILEANRRWEEILGVPRSSMAGRHIREYSAPGHEETNEALYLQALTDSTGGLPPVPISGVDGATVYMEFSNNVARIDGEDFVLAIGRNVTENVLARRDLAVSEEKHRLLIEHLPDVVWSGTLDGKLIFLSPRVEAVCGFTADEIRSAAPSFWFDRIHADDVDAVRQAFAEMFWKGYEREYRWRHKDGHWVWIRSRATARVEAGGDVVVEGTFADISERKQLEEQVRQSQRMEAIGQLTGGIAHDFNNMLAVILGNGEFVREVTPESDPRRSDIDAVLDAGQRAATLTRQLLAFSRRQVLDPRSLDLNHAVIGVEKMLRRVIGEDIELSVSLADPLGRVLADAGQIDQVLMNLVVNARDAMAHGGKLSIETANVTLHASLGNGDDVVPAGEYVRLTVADTGCGMTAETKRRIFEPFFTTKESGKGTGLGLSTCYGIVKQSGGAIAVESEPAAGCIFRIYLPRFAGEPDAVRVDVDTTDLTGSKTILLVEDDACVRATVRRVLHSLGYRVLEACDGQEAVALALSQNGCIDLVLTDVVIPDLSGPEIVSRLQRAYGPIRFLFMSGYSDHPALHDPAIAGGLNFIEKPFAPAAIAKRVREVLNAPLGK
jgi:two-component system cell cycle sensor histidine kinase/response regulator CckA